MRRGWKWGRQIAAGLEKVNRNVEVLIGENEDAQNLFELIETAFIVVRASGWWWIYRTARTHLPTARLFR